MDEAEKYLFHYSSLYRAVGHAEFMIERILYQSCPKDIGAASNDITGVFAARPVNTFQEIFELSRWKEVKKRSDEEIKHIEELLAGLDERERKVLKMWYVDKMSVTDIAADMNFSERKSVYNLKNRALKNFSVILFGISALNAI
jgi:DNA-directed RNA polymerase specialized sigma24 family protein